MLGYLVGPLRVPGWRVGRRQLEPRKGRAPLAAGPGHRHGIQGTDNIRAEIHSKGSAQALGCPRAGLRARETGGGGRPARFCQEETHVLAEQFSSMEHDARSVFRISQTKRSKPAFNGQAVDRGEARPSASNDFHRGTPDGSTEADERPLQRGDHPVVRELSRLGRSLGVRRGRARPDLRSAPRRGLAPGPGWGKRPCDGSN